MWHMGGALIREYEIQFDSHHIRLAVFDGSGGAAQGIFASGEYPYFNVGPVRTIIDAGANVGASSIYFSLLHPGATVFAFEPVAQTCALLERNTAPYPSIRVVRAGLSDWEGEAEINVGVNDETSSLFTCRHTSPHKDKVAIRRLSRFLPEAAIDVVDILKVDTEGAELAILTDALGCCAPKLIYLEFHSEADRIDIDRLLTGAYTLYWANIQQPHRGNLVYIARALIPDVVHSMDTRRSPAPSPAGTLP